MSDTCCIIANAKKKQKLTAGDLMKPKPPMKKATKKKSVSPWLGLGLASWVVIGSWLLFMK